MFIGGVILDVRLDRNRYKRGCYGYMDPDTSLDGGMSTNWHDFFSFNVSYLLNYSCHRHNKYMHSTFNNVMDAIKK